MEPLRIIPKLWTEIERRQYLQELFSDRYSEFMRWALQITRFDQSAAEEILHDIYVDFARTLPDLHIVKNLDGYLYESLRNLNTSRKRRAWKHNHESLDILEFDSLRARLRMRRGADSLELRDQLERLCLYLCWRKQNVRSASLLLLRFFRNYYPEEIAHVARLSRKAVNVQIGRSRNEARAYIESAAKWDALGDLKVKMPLSKPRRAEGDDALMRQFSDMIRLNRNGECLSDGQLENFYAAESTHAPDTEQLAHLVSCDECLRRVGSYLLDDSSKGDRSLESEVGGHEAAQRAIEMAEETVRDLLDHDPSALILAVNGEDVLEYSVTTMALEQVVAIPPSTDLKFVEVFDRVGQRLLKIDVRTTPPDGPAEVRSEVLLAGDRSLCVALQWYGSEPSIHLQYAAVSGKQRPEVAPLELVPRVLPVMLGGHVGDIKRKDWHRLPAKLWAVLRRWIEWRRLVPIIALITALMAWTFYRRLTSGPEMDSGAILLATQRAESAAGSTQEVSHRTIGYEERTGDGSTVKIGRVEVWRGGNRVATRFYDEQGKLTAGEWKDGSSTEAILNNGGLQSKESGKNCFSETNAWSCDLSANAFSKAGSKKDNWKAETLPSEYVIHLVRAAAASNGSATSRLLRADLHIDRKTMRSRQENLWIESGKEVREYRLIEAVYEPHTGLKLDNPVLKPDASRNRPPYDHTLPPALPIDKLTKSALAHLQLQVMSRLHDVNADVGKPLIVERTNDGRISIRGVLSSDQEAKAIRGALADLAGDPRLKERIYSVAEFQTPKHQKADKRIVIEQYEVNAEQCPAESSLRSHFQSLGYRDNQIEEQIHQYIQKVLGESAKALQEAWTLHQFSQSFGAADLASLSIGDQRIWSSLLEQHSQALAASLESLRRSVDWSLQTEADSSNLPVAPQRVTPLTTTVEGVLTQTTEINHLLRSMFMVSADGDMPTKPPDLQRLLSAAQSDLLKVRTASRQYSASLRMSNQ